MNEAAAPVKVPGFVTCLGHGQPKTGAERGARLHRAGGICVNGIRLLESCLFILAGTGRLFGEHLPFPQHKYSCFVYKGKNPNPN